MSVVHEINDALLPFNGKNILPTLLPTTRALFALHLAYFTPSCGPNTFAVNDGSRIVVRALRPIKEGELITRSNGLNYFEVTRSKRREYLLSEDGADCGCQACNERWPVYEGMAAWKAKGACKCWKELEDEVMLELLGQKSASTKQRFCSPDCKQASLMLTYWNLNDPYYLPI